MMRTRRRTVPLLLAAAVLVAGCTKAGDTASNGGGGGADAGSGGSGGTSVTVEQLEELLPARADLDPAYRPAEDDDDDDGAAMDDALEEACPDAAALSEQLGTDEDEDEGQKATRAFEAADGRSFEVTLNAAPKSITDDEFEAMTDALNGCDEITFSEGGFDYTMVLEVETDDELGDQAFRATFLLTAESSALPEPLEIELHALSFRRGSVGVTIMATDGIDEDTFQAIPADVELVEEWGERLDSEVADLQG